MTEMARRKSRSTKPRTIILRNSKREHQETGKHIGLANEAPKGERAKRDETDYYVVSKAIYKELRTWAMRTKWAGKKMFLYENVWGDLSIATQPKQVEYVVFAEGDKWAARRMLRGKFYPIKLGRH
jgi:hypothetical protein